MPPGGTFLKCSIIFFEEEVTNKKKIVFFKNEKQEYNGLLFYSHPFRPSHGSGQEKQRPERCSAKMLSKGPPTF